MKTTKSGSRWEAYVNSDRPGEVFIYVESGEYTTSEAKELSNAISELASGVSECYVVSSNGERQGPYTEDIAVLMKQAYNNLTYADMVWWVEDGADT